MVNPLKTYYLFSIFATLFCMIMVLSMPLKSYAFSPDLYSWYLSSEVSIPNSSASNDTLAMINKGIELNKIGKYNESIAFFDMVLAADPKNVVVLNEKGNAYGGLGNYSQAIVSYDKALDLDPNSYSIRCCSSEQEPWNCSLDSINSRILWIPKIGHMCI